MQEKLFKNRINILKYQEDKAKRYAEEMQRRAKQIDEFQKIREEQFQYVFFIIFLM